MTALIIEWDPERPGWRGTFASDVGTVRSTGVLRQRWMVPARTPLDHGMDVWLIVAGRRPAMRGLIGHGSLAGIASDGAAAGGTDEPAQCIEVDFDNLLPHGDQVPLDQLIERLPALAGGFGVLAVDGGTGVALRSLWAATGSPEPGSLDPIPGALPSTATQHVVVNRFERDPELRRVAVAHRGSACHACGMDFEQGYGGAADLIQVHHITPLELVDSGYEVDPLVDLIPLCANCHVVAHSRWPEPLTVEEIRTRLRTSGFLRGSVLTDEQLDAEAAAARILGA
ncbi:HNH endonuclease [Arthrobacter burdickii]|uniref:HNH endonuclease n=1 Tax=Arthrobacter burdickii TaxID=3035920 RepID=A0ABT8K388_9MICC|nr:HNH endonuclease [Arthrobacter burdickii]MDN4611901.1 HNH endonuclease [Arthrobacter burdickii]